MRTGHEHKGTDLPPQGREAEGRYEQHWRNAKHQCHGIGLETESRESTCSVVCLDET